MFSKCKHSLPHISWDNSSFTQNFFDNSRSTNLDVFQLPQLMIFPSTSPELSSTGNSHSTTIYSPTSHFSPHSSNMTPILIQPIPTNPSIPLIAPLPFYLSTCNDNPFSEWYLYSQSFIQSSYLNCSFSIHSQYP